MILVKLAPLAIVALLMPLLGLAAPKPRPNFVIILADDLDATTSQYWERASSQGLSDPLAKTRALIKDRGATFTEAFAPTPICCPARSTLLTGKLGHNTGVLTNRGEWGGWAAFKKNGNEERTIAVALQKAGYRTGLAGKYLNGLEEDPKHVPPGWNRWFAAVDVNSYRGYDYELNENGTLVSYRHKPGHYLTDVIRGHAIQFLRETESMDDQPFFLMLTPTAPHMPIPPAPRHRDHPYRHAEVPQTPNFQERDLSDKSAWLRRSGFQRKLSVDLYQTQDYRKRQGSLYSLDEMVEAVVKQLEAQGELEHTYLLFLSDNGYNLGAHRLLHKMAPYEESIRVPLVVRGPGIRAGRQLDTMTLLCDLAPTISEWAGVPLPDTADGVSLAPLLRDETPEDWREDFSLRYVGGEVLNGIGIEIKPWMNSLLGLDFPTYQGLRTREFLYVRYELDGAFEEELYDLKADPYQLDNLLSRAGFVDPLLHEFLKSRLEELSRCAGPNCFRKRQ